MAKGKEQTWVEIKDLEGNLTGGVRLEDITTFNINISSTGVYVSATYTERVDTGFIGNVISSHKTEEEAQSALRDLLRSPR